ncbi:hypothetical protein Tco_1055232 [Tanacetum coccineum]|uniref:Uncharacterized protein n=1 Tax=Tanacetum coccineum TaxID=301880 RepID=A0ABQ5GZS9_9ASTR
MPSGEPMNEEPVAPPSPDYIPGSEDPQTPPVPQNEDDHEFPAEEQQLPHIDSPTAESPGHMLKRGDGRLETSVWMEEEEPKLPEGVVSLEGLSQAIIRSFHTHRDHDYSHETHLQGNTRHSYRQTNYTHSDTATGTMIHRFQMQQAELAALRETDRRRQDQMVETLRVIRDMRQEMSDMQAELLALRENKEKLDSQEQS